MVLLQVQQNIFLSILLCAILMHAFFYLNKTTKANMLFIMIMILTSLGSLTETATIILNNKQLQHLIVWNKLSNVVGFMCAPSILFIGYLFFREWVGRHQKEKIKFNKLMIVPLIINAVVSVMGYFGTGIFRITSDNVYERGPLFLVTPFVNYIYIMYNMYFIYKHRKNFTRGECIVFLQIFLIPAITTMIQLKYSSFLVIWNSISMIVIFIYIYILTEQIYHDQMTGLGNRLSFDLYMSQRKRKKWKNLFLIYMDLDDFKIVNDQYGHLEGDEALRVFSKLLRKSFLSKRAELNRIGGDEFIVTIDKSHQEEVETYINILNSQVDEYNKLQLKPYKIGFSYGYACYSNEFENIFQLMENADKAMYEQKQIKKLKNRLQIEDCV